MAPFMKVLMMFLVRDENDDFAPRALRFIGTFVASFGEEVDVDGGSHPIIHHVLEEILSVSSGARFATSLSL